MQIYSYDKSRRLKYLPKLISTIPQLEQLDSECMLPRRMLRRHVDMPHGPALPPRHIDILQAPQFVKGHIS